MVIVQNQLFLKVIIQVKPHVPIHFQFQACS